MMQDSIAEKVFVSVQCLVYNHASYLRQCLDGFVMQKTSFKYEVIVHDDASTDGSTDIIRDYAQKFPNIFKVIIQHQNVYSKGISPTKKYVLPLCTGKYIAMCEGDDYWTDPYKLQKQVDYMEAHPECAICFHPVMVHDQRTGDEYPDTLTKVPQITTINDLARLSNYIHMPSVMYRHNQEVIWKMEQLGKTGVGDYLMSMLYAENGNICKLPDYMAVYRQGVGVWTGPNSDGEKNMFTWIVAISKLLSVLQDPEVKRLIDEQIDSMVGELLTSHRETEKQLLQIRSSKAYRLGKALLKPFSWLKKIGRK
mgnify:CR=1 FL=1